MSEKSKIEWTDATWNPVRGCVKVSPGCAHCYAETFAERFRGVKGHPFEQGFDLRIVPHKLVDPATWGKSKVVFVNSMSDLFQNGVPDEYVETVCRVMQRVDWHSYQVLTKRSQRMRELLSTKLAWAAELENVIWGVSVENRKHGFPRLEDLRNTPARYRFLSIEPLIEDLGQIDLTGMDWVIVGGESGSNDHPMDEQWVLSLRDQCVQQNVPFFFKQWGGFNKKKNGRLLEGRIYDEKPLLKTGPVPSLADRKAIQVEIERMGMGF